MVAPEPIRLVVLLSGSGRTLQNLQDRIAAGRLSARIVGVVASRPDVVGVERARRMGVRTTVTERRACADAAEFGRRVWAEIAPLRPDLVVLAGFLCYLPIPADFTHKVVNIHPALLPAFGGKGMYGDRVHQAVLQAGAKVSGCTVHFVDNEYDHGPIIAQRTVPVLETDTPHTLAERVFAAECETYPEVIQWFADGRLRVEGGCVRIRP